MTHGLPPEVSTWEALAREGFATVLVVSPNTLYESQFHRAQREAQDAGSGLWRACLATH